MDQDPSSPTGLFGQGKGILGTIFTALQNRGELLLLEIEEEKTRVLELLIWAMAVGFLGVMFLAMITVFAILLTPPGIYRLYVVGGFSVFYLIAAALAFWNLNCLIKQSSPPFTGSLGEMKKDVTWLDSSK